jgi:hypothetical protein
MDSRGSHQAKSSAAGRVELDAKLPEGTSVTVIAPDDDGTFTADPATEKMLLESIAQCDQGQTVDINSFSPTCIPRSERPAAGMFPSAFRDSQDRRRGECDRSKSPRVKTPCAASR